MDASSTAIARLAEAIGYPAEIPAGARRFTFVVDGNPLEAVEEAGRLRFVKVLQAGTDAEGALVRLAGYATGRILKEEAVFAWDPTLEAPILWQDVPATADGAVLRRFFEVFTASCDWWAARTVDEPVYSRVPEMMILP